jgi:uncharacterized membrane protein
MFELLPLAAIDAVAVTSRVLHVGSGVMLLGGLLYVRLVLAPALASGGDAEQVLFAGRRKAWGWAGRISALLLLVSGTYNLLRYIGAVQLPPLYHMLFGMKFLLGLVLMFLAELLAGRSSLAQKMRGAVVPATTFAALVGVAILALGAVLREIRSEVPPKISVVADEPAASDTP